MKYVSVAVSLVIAISAAAAEPDIDALIENGHWKRARDAASALLKARPNDAHAAYQLSRVHHEFKNADEAVKYGELAVQLDPKVAAHHLALGRAYIDQLEKSSFVKAMGLSKKTRAEYDAASAIAPKHPETLLAQMGYFLNAPGIAGGDKKKAFEIANEPVGIDPAQGYLALASIAIQQKENSKVDALLQKAVESDPRSYAARLNLPEFLDTNAVALWIDVVEFLFGDKLFGE